MIIIEECTDIIRVIDGEQGIPGIQGETGPPPEVTWEVIGGDQSVINLSGFTNDAGFVTDASKWTLTGSDIYYNDGSVGIGKTPTEELDVDGKVLSNHFISNQNKTYDYNVDGTINTITFTDGRVITYTYSDGLLVSWTDTVYEWTVTRNVDDEITNIDVVKL